MSIRWTIIAARGGFEIKDGERTIGTIKAAGMTWLVNFPGKSWLDFEWSGGSKSRSATDAAMNICFGYVRGIERVFSLVAVT